MPIPVLPQELVDHIVDHLQGDFAALKCCALVCRAWLSPSRSHIFRRISLQPPQPTRSFFGWGRRPAIRSLLLAIQTAPEIASYIQDVEVVNGEWNTNENTLVQLLFSMTNVRRLEFRRSTATRMAWRDLSSDLKSSILHILASPSLYELDMGMMSFDSTGELRQILGGSRNLRVLSLDHLHIGCSSDHQLDAEVDLQHTSHAPLDTLVLGTRISPLVAASLLDPHSILDITSLRNLSMSISDDFGEFSRLLRSAVCLESLDLLLMSDIDLVAYQDIPSSERLDLSHNPYIQALTVRIDVMIRQDDPLPWLNELLTTFTTPNNLRDVHIVYSLYLPSPYMDRSVNTTIFTKWLEIDATLTGPVFNSLDRVWLEFSLENPIGFDVAPRFLKEVDLQSPALRESDRLVVDAFDTSR
ncbi:hypothetical protein C0991_007113 [Blastosporella zonata]|nr:hypothetical protein C0991_007113 [Blastosporella zonata]